MYPDKVSGSSASDGKQLMIPIVDADDGLNRGTPSWIEIPDGRRVPTQEVLTHVCARWRHVALEQRQLWVVLNNFFPSRLEAWLQRSAGLPLDVHLAIIRPLFFASSGPHFCCFTRMLELLSRHVARWRTWTLSCYDYRYMYLVLNRLSWCPSDPLLASLGLVIIDPTDPSICEDTVRLSPAPLVTPMALFRGNAPRLSILKLSGGHLDWTTCPEYFPGLPTLELEEHVEVVRPSYADFKAMIDSCPKLRHLVLSLSGPLDLPISVPDSGTIFLPALEPLTFQDLDPTECSALIRHLSVSRLRGLTINQWDGDHTSIVRVLLAWHLIGTLVSTPRASVLAGLRFLDVSELPCDPDVVVQLLNSLDNLTTILLDFRQLPFLWLKALGSPRIETSADDGELKMVPRCPCLVGFWACGLNGEQVIEFVRQRFVLGAPLREVKVDPGVRITLEDRRWFDPNDVLFELDDRCDNMTWSRSRTTVSVWARRAPL